MKTLNNISKNNLFVIVRTNGINADVMITDKKNLGAHVASMLYGPKCGTKTYNVIVTDMPKDKLKVMGELGLLQTKAYINRYCISIQNEKYKHIMEIATEENQYDIKECISSYNFKSFHLFFARRDNEYFVMKANDPYTATSYLKTVNNFEIIDSKRIDSQETAAFMAMYNRFTGKENENAIPYIAVTKQVFDALHLCINTNTLSK